MRRLMKLLHELTTALLMGSLVAVMLTVRDPDPAVRHAMERLVALVVVPAAVGTIVTGLLSMLTHRSFLDAGWVWLKAALGWVVGTAALFSIQVGVRDVLTLGANDPELAHAMEHVWRASWVVQLASAAAIGVGIWRPRLFPRVASAAADEAPPGLDEAPVAASNDEA